VTKYTPYSLDKAVLATIPLYILLCNEADQCLTHRKTYRVTHNKNNSARLKLYRAHFDISHFLGDSQGSCLM
jgi:hypothetical protein